MVAGTNWPLAVLLLGTTAAYAQKPGAPRAQARTTEIEVRSLAFLSAHGGFSDNADSYRRGGKLIESPEWTRSRNLPVTQTGGTRLDLAVVLQADTAAHAESVRIVARVRGSSRLAEGLLVGTGVERNGVITANRPLAPPPCTSPAVL